MELAGFVCKLDPLREKRCPFLPPLQLAQLYSSPTSLIVRKWSKPKHRPSYRCLTTFFTHPAITYVAPVGAPFFLLTIFCPLGLSYRCAERGPSERLSLRCKSRCEMDNRFSPLAAQNGKKV